MDDKIRTEFIQKQKDLCAMHDWPFFMPSNGVCGTCHQDIIPREIQCGNDGSQLVTGCRLCCRSYCD